MRLIDEEQIGLTDMEIIMCDGNYKKALEMLIDKIANAPTIEVPQRMRGRWETDAYGAMDEGEYLMTRCSVCGTAYEYGHDDRYCGFCGAAMEAQDETS